MALQLRRKYRVIANPSLLRFYSFSSSSSSNPSDPSPENPTNASSPSPQSPVSSYFSDVKASLKRHPAPPRRPTTGPSSFSGPSSSPPSKAASLEEIRRNLSEFRLRTAAPPSDSTFSSSQPISFQELYKKNMASRNEGSNANSGSGTVSGGKITFDGIRERLRQIRPAGATTEPTERRGTEAGFLRDTLRVRPAESSMESKVIGVPVSVFGKEMGEKKDWGERSTAMKTEFVKMYNYEELGTKLKTLRSETAEKGGFSVSELNERLVKLREMEEQEAESRVGGVPYRDLRESLVTLRMSDAQNANRTPVKLNVLGGIAETPDYMLQPPKDHLVERYFHPDNMSAAEKLKLELQKVREEFKMTESDCGSARVQVAQLTTKIKHLSSVLHKKDKHSRKGLVAMVQRRKKLLKYLRRTDWDSYCFVLSKLGLRDNPDYKN